MIVTLKQTRLILYGVKTIYFVVFVVKSARKVIPSLIVFINVAINMGLCHVMISDETVGNNT